MTNTTQSDWHHLREVELVLFREAELADSNLYKKWLSLWTKELLYWVPCNADDIDPARHISLIYDDWPALEERLFRLETNHAHAQRPQSKLTRLVSNVVLQNYDPACGGALTTRFVAVEMRRDRPTIWSGRTHHWLVREEGHLRIKKKQVFLVNNDAPMNNLTFVI
jgi:3-phenylpropionate/cinnamic acid dioxygenase small subunit